MAGLGRKSHYTGRRAAKTYTHTFDAENRLTSVIMATGTITFTYDGDGNRVKVTTSGVTTPTASTALDATFDNIRLDVGSMPPAGPRLG